MEQVVAIGGTGKRAAVVGYRVAGKTGTAWKSIPGGYSTNKHMLTFAGLVPATHPKLAAVVVIDEPEDSRYQAADIAAPVYSNILTGALRLMDVPPDDLQNVPAATLVQASATP
jgi:cell division protein FtsI (penicillin-binding protein 3)